MFDNEINFLPPKMKSGKIRNKKKREDLVKPQTLYTKPEEPFREKQKPEKISEHSGKSKNPNFFKKVGAFFGKFLKTKKKKFLIEKPKQSPKKFVAEGQSDSNKIIEPIVAKPIKSSPENKVKNVSQIKPLVYQKKEMSPDMAKATVLPVKPTHLTVPSVSGTNHPKEAGVNLMPEGASVNIDFKNKILVLVAGLVFVAVVLGLSFLGIRLYSRSFAKDSASAQEELLDIENEINVYKEYRQEYQGLSEKINLALNLIKKHKHWSKLFPVIESITHSDVLYSSFVGDISGQITLSSSAPGFRVLAQQILILKDSGTIIENFDISEIGLVSFNASDDSDRFAPRVAFNLTLKFNPDFFLSLENQP